MFCQRFLAMFVCLLFVVGLGACGASHSPTSTASSISTATSIPQNTTTATSITPVPTVTVTVAAQATKIEKTGTGPIIIASPTIVPGSSTHAQQVVLTDRTLIIESTSKQRGMDAASTAISITMMLKNTSSHAITNQTGYFQLLGTEGDIFGLQSSATATFFGTITAGSVRSGTIVFQVPSSAASGLHLLYSPDVATERTIVPLF